MPHYPSSTLIADNPQTAALNLTTKSTSEKSNQLAPTLSEGSLPQGPIASAAIGNNLPILPIQLIPAKLPSGELVLLMTNSQSISVLPTEHHQLYNFQGYLRVYISLGRHRQ